MNLCFWKLFLHSVNLKSVFNHSTIFRAALFTYQLSYSKLVAQANPTFNFQPFGYAQGIAFNPSAMLSAALVPCHKMFGGGDAFNAPLQFFTLSTTLRTALVPCPLSPFGYAQCGACHLSLATCHPSATLRAALATCHLSLATCPLQLVTCHFTAT